MSLRIRNKFSLIDGSPEKLVDGTQDLKAWHRCNTLSMSWLLHYVAHGIKNTILYLEDAKTAWKKLRVRYEQPEYVRSFQLQQELGSITRGQSHVTEYFTKLNGIWVELNNYNQIHIVNVDSVSVT